jgi:hypothetical protein
VLDGVSETNKTNYLLRDRLVNPTLKLRRY